MEVEANSQASSVVDNSDNASDLNAQIAAALQEPTEQEEETTTVENNEDTTEQEPETKEEQKDNTFEYPEKFKNEDGTVNVEKLAKSYKELEKMQGSKSAEWEKERAELLKYKEKVEESDKAREEEAKKAGYESALDMEQNKQVANFEANEYAKYLQYCEEPDVVRQMLIDYANNPSDALMREIELEFAPEVNKQIAIQSDRMKQSFETEKQQRNQTAILTSIENVISQSIDSNSELFSYEPFKELFIKTLQKYQDNFTQEDATLLMDTVVKLKDLFRAEYEKDLSSKKQNDKATDNLAGITGNNSAPSNDAKDFNSMSDAELRKMIRQLI